MSRFSDASSELSDLPSRSPTPPFDFLMCPSPPSTQDSSRQTPCPDDTSSGSASSAEDGDARPAKRRRITPTMPRDTTRLDLDDMHNAENQASLDRLIKAIRTKRKIVVVAGAGISVSAGIPDFRSSGGLFNSLKSQHNLKGSGKQLFDAAVYRDSDSTSSFHDMVRSLSSITKTARPTRFHHLLASLAQEGRLLRLYSQNVDGIDTSLPPLHTQVPLPRKAPWPKTIQLHGGLSKMVCTKCSALNDFEAELFDGPIPPACQQCEQLDYTRTEVAGKRSHGVGKLRPRMVLYNEGNPDDEAIGSCAKADLRRRPDCIIVVGTTLKVPGVKRIVREMCGIVRDHRDGLSVWINSDPEPAAKEFENSWDIIVKGTSDDVAEHAALRQWDDENIDEIKVMSEAEVDEIRNKAGLKVVVDSPTKQRVLSPGSLPTPVDSPRPSLQRTYSDASISQVKVKKLTLTMNNPASKGRRLDDLLPALPQRAALKGGPSKRATTGSKSKGDETSKPRGRPPKAAAPVKAPPKKRGPKKVEPTRNGQIDFQISKVNPLVKPNKKDMAQVKRPEPLTASPSRENLPSPPRPSEAKAGEGKIIAA